MRCGVFVLILLLLSRFAVAQQSMVPAITSAVPNVSLSGETEVRRLNSFGELELRRFKKQALQSFSVSSGYLADLGNDGFNSGFLDVSIGTGIPLGSFSNILGVKPGFRIDWIDADADIDIPNELYEFEVQLFYRKQLRERLSIMGIFSPSIRSDLTTDKDAFRVFALALINWQCIPDRLTVSGGAVYLGRADLPVVPALGLTWTPTPLARLDLQFPRTRFSYRLAKDGGCSELWSYLSVGLGGNTWAVTRKSGLTDELSLRDFRLTTGLQRLVDGGGGCYLETGVALSRRLEYENDDTDIDLGDAFVIEGGWRY